MEREIAIEVKNLYISYRNLQKFSIKQSLLTYEEGTGGCVPGGKGCVL